MIGLLISCLVILLLAVGKADGLEELPAHRFHYSGGLRR